MWASTGWTLGASYLILCQMLSGKCMSRGIMLAYQQDVTLGSFIYPWLVIVHVLASMSMCISVQRWQTRWSKRWHLSRWNGAELDYNQDDARQTVVNWIDGTGGTSCAFDFPTKGILQEAVKNCQYWRLRDQNGKPPGVIGYYPKRSVTFIDNHDTGVSRHPAAI